jgi:predicted RNase H-like HicB family nuclease
MERETPCLTWRGNPLPDGSERKKDSAQAIARPNGDFVETPRAELTRLEVDGNSIASKTLEIFKKIEIIRLILRKFSGGEIKMREFTVIIQKDEEGYYVAEVPGLKGCHTQARSLDELMERVKEAIELCLEVYGEEAFEGLELIGVQKIAV